MTKFKIRNSRLAFMASMPKPKLWRWQQAESEAETSCKKKLRSRGRRWSQLLKMIQSRSRSQSRRIHGARVEVRAIASRDRYCECTYLNFPWPVDTSTECDPVCYYVSATSHFYHVSGELNLSVVHGRAWCLCRCVQSLRNWQHIIGGCGSAPALSSASDGGSKGSV